MSFRLLAIVALAFQLVACSAVDPASLKKPAQAQSIDLPQNFVYVTPVVGMVGNKFKYELLSGKYVAQLADADGGTYFRGPEGSVRMSQVQEGGKPVAEERVRSIEGGIYMPANPADPARMWIIYGTGKYVDGMPVENALPIAVTAAPGASPVMAGLGAGLAAGLVNAMIAADTDRGKMIFTAHQAPDLRSVITVRND